VRPVGDHMRKIGGNKTLCRNGSIHSAPAIRSIMRLAANI
jgi:hypothetical protein